MKFPEPGKCPRVFICHPLLSSWVEFNYPPNFGVCARCWDWPRHFEWEAVYIPENPRKARPGERGSEAANGPEMCKFLRVRCCLLSFRNYYTIVKIFRGKIRASACPPLTSVAHKAPPHLQPVEESALPTHSENRITQADLNCRCAQLLLSLTPVRLSRAI